MRTLIIVHVEAIDRHIEALSNRIASGNAPYLKQGLVRAARWYMAFIRRRFLRASRGDGTWEELKPLTKEIRARKLARRSKEGKIGNTAHERRQKEFLGKLTERQKEGFDTQFLHFPILRDTGALFNSLTPGGAGYVEHLSTPLVIQVGTSIPYAATHQFGRPPPPNRIPARPILVPPDDPTIRGIESEIITAVNQEIDSLQTASP